MDPEDLRLPGTSSLGYSCRRAIPEAVRLQMPVKWRIIYSKSAVYYGNSCRPGRPPKRAPVGLSLAASHLSQQLKKHRMDNGDYPGYENGHISAEPGWGRYARGSWVTGNIWLPTSPAARFADPNSFRLLGREYRLGITTERAVGVK
ncbi:hypothetical protein AAG570_003703 [Ranatra chinensis]|uniref:Uncharacterized protein n=1 Tax=Ranatra chinensis TaxID=642074 RepID=A0ABD0Y4G2_9HEMI